jgi:hypothetical protein
VRARWPDGTIKWLLVDTQVSVEPMARIELPVEYADGIEMVEIGSRLHCVESQDALEIETGSLRLSIARRGPTLFRNITWEGIEILRRAEVSEFTAMDGNGTHFGSQIDSVAIEEQNPLRIVLLAKGRYRAENGSPFMSWVARLYCFAGKPFVKLYHTFIQDTAAQSVELRRMRIGLTPDMGGEIEAALGAKSTQSPHGYAFSGVTEPISLTQLMIGQHVLDDGSPTVLDGNAHGWVRVGNRNAAVTIKLRKPWQNYPKAYRVGPEELSLDLYPDAADNVGESARSGSQPGALYEGPLRVPQGMAKTHELFIQLGPAGTNARTVDYQMLALEQPLLLNLPSEHYATSGAFGSLPAVSDSYWPLEMKLRELCKPPGGLGILNYGDEVNLRMVDGRLQTRTTENLAYDLPSSLLRQSLRTRDQHLFSEAEAAAFHLMDVDTVHFDTTHPEWIGGPRCAWSQNHHYTTAASGSLAGPRVSHTWLGGLLDYYFITGYKRAREVAESCADYCRRSAPYKWKDKLSEQVQRQALEPEVEWPFNARDVGWSLTAMGTFFNAFPEERFLRAMETLVDLAELWQDDEGRWRQSIGSFNRGSDPSASAAILQGLQLYFEATSDRRAYEVLLRGVTFLVNHGRTVEGLFYCYESPIADRPHSPAAELFGPLVFAFEATRDSEILESGFRFFKWLMDSGEVKACMLREIFAVIPLLDRMSLLESYRGPDLTSAIGNPSAPGEDRT